MELALGAATVAVARAGASTLAELAAMRVPAIVVPFPAAVDDHQYYNARAMAQDGAVRVLRQDAATPERLGAAVLEIVRNDRLRGAMGAAIARWHTPDAAERLARLVWRRLGVLTRERPVSGLTDSGGALRVGAKLRRA
jgi:UDP-N-acetylglucosamine--N-acetylmuramyl-(pentapeptide) pyrophosphoryl-undecaprenol N-acetylglucosamine transferase